MGKKYDSLNGMRAYAAIAILAMHVLENSEYTGIASIVSTKVDLLKWLIYLFMIISGFSLCCGYYERILHQSISIVEFYKKRYKKILPFFALLVFMDCMMNLSLNSVIEGIADITLVYALLPNASISVLGVGWFLGIVFLFYMIFPFYCFWMRSKKNAWLTFAVCVFYNLSEQLYFLDSSHVYRNEFMVYVKKYRYGYLLVILLMTIASFYAWPQISGLVEPFVCLIVFSLWIIYAISVESIVLNNKWVTFISGISLEIYLCHMFVYRILEKMHILYILWRGYLAYVSMVFVTLFGSICVSLLSQKGIAKIESVVKRICEPK